MLQTSPLTARALPAFGVIGVMARGGASVVHDRPAAPEPGPRPPPRLLERVRTAIRARHYSHRTEKAYVGWIKRFIFFHHKRHPNEMGEAEITVCASSSEELLQKPGTTSWTAWWRCPARPRPGQRLAKLALLLRTDHGLELRVSQMRGGQGSSNRWTRSRR